MVTGLIGARIKAGEGDHGISGPEEGALKRIEQAAANFRVRQPRQRPVMHQERTELTKRRLSALADKPVANWTPQMTPMSPAVGSHQFDTRVPGPSLALRHEALIIASTADRIYHAIVLIARSNGTPNSRAPSSLERR